MKRISKVLMLSLFLAVSLISVSCKKDIETITLKRSGSARVIVKNGETLLGDKEVRLINADTGNEIDILSTDAQGVVNLQNLIEGNYGISVEVDDPIYSNVYQEFQIMSGESREITVQVTDFIGTLTVYLVDEDKDALIKEDLAIGIAAIPRSDAYLKALTNQEKIALATEIKYFGTEGVISFENLPTGSYDIYRVKADTIEALEDDNIYISKLDKRFYQMHVDFVYEKLFSKPSFAVAGVYDYNTEAAVTDFPFSSFKFYHSSEGDMLKLELSNGVFFTMECYLDSDGDINIYSIQSSNEDYNLGIDEDAWRINEDGNFEFDFYAVEIYDYSDENLDMYFDDIAVTLE